MGAGSLRTLEVQVGLGLCRASALWQKMNQDGS